jgi:alkanesulfonate monooxygenase SsuD/methylene tetrahydromethanopterin reductase-like flavin-dependent oxidoreductase (luciferase family)
MDLCVWPAYERSWSEVVEVSTWGESAGFSGVWYADHFMPQTDDDSPGHGPALECWTVLAAIGATVPRLRLTSMVSPVTIHHPVVLAKRVATVDHITGGGRTVLGIGAGWQVNEHTTYGFELPAPGERVTRFERAVEQIHGLLHDESIPFDPRPASLPVLVGTGSPRMMRITARWADVWNTWGDPAQLAERTAMFLEACHRVGRDPGTVKRSAQAMVFLTNDDRTRDMAEPAGGRHAEGLRAAPTTHPRHGHERHVMVWPQQRVDRTDGDRRETEDRQVGEHSSDS